MVSTGINSTLPNIVKKWMANYMYGYLTFVKFRYVKLKSTMVKEGVPRVGILFTILFNFYLSKLPTAH